MKKEAIKLDDWQRILLGETPGEFMLEVLVRTVIIFVIFVVVVRLLGKRMNGQLTGTELAVMLTLGALIAPAMQLPDKGILLGTVTLLCILVFQRGLTRWGGANSRVERLTQGIETALIKDGILQLDKMAAGRISHQQLFAVLRAEQVYNLKKVTRLYLEACGLFSLYQAEANEPGLSLLPRQRPELQHADWQGIQEPAPGVMACQHCGNTLPASEITGACPVCTSTQWTQAVH